MNTLRLLTLLLCATLGACATGKISPRDRAAIHTIHIINPPSGAEPNSYSDSTSEAASQVGSQFGLIGGLIGGGIAAYDISSGVKRWAPVTAGSQGRVLQLLHEDVEKEFAQNAKLRVATNGAGDAQLVFTRISYGVAHSGHQQFKAAIHASVEMKKTDGTVVWRKFASSTSTANLTLEQYQKDPAAYPCALQEGVQNLARDLVASY